MGRKYWHGHWIYRLAIARLFTLTDHLVEMTLMVSSYPLVDINSEGPEPWPSFSKHDLVIVDVQPEMP